MRVLAAEDAIHPQALIGAILVPMSTLFAVAALDSRIIIFIEKSTFL
jgi:hypothetical protein